jgi:Domain of unknown function (DUF2019)
VEIAMRKSKKSALSIKDMVDQFKQLSIASSEILGDGGVRAANRAGVKLNRLACQIRAMDDQGRKILEELIESEVEAVRSDAAYFLLPINPDLATLELENLAKNASNVFLLTSAKTTLEEWSAGRLDTDWFIRKYGPKKISDASPNKRVA